MTKLTKKDIAKYIFKIQLNFENAYRFDTDDERQLLIESWMDIFGQYPKEICDIAVNNALSHAKYAPRFGDIMEEIQILLNPDKKTEAELWAELMDIKYEVYDLSRFLHYPQHYDNYYKKLKKIYNNLSDELKLYFVNLSSLIEFSELTKEELPFEKNRFFRNLPILRQHVEAKNKSTKFLHLLEQKGLKLEITTNSEDE